MQCFIVKIVLSLCQYPAVPQPTHRQVMLVNLVTLPYILQLFIGDSSSLAGSVAAGIIIFAVMVIVVVTVIIFIIR